MPGQDPHITVTYNGTTTRLALRRGRAIQRNPITGLGQVVTTGDNAERSDQRTPQIIWGDQTGGLGEFAYTETDGISTFTDSACDTRFPGEIVLPPLAQGFGTYGTLDNVAATNNTVHSLDAPVQIDYLGATTPNSPAVWLAYQTFNAVNLNISPSPQYYSQNGPGGAWQYVAFKDSAGNPIPTTTATANRPGMVSGVVQFGSNYYVTFGSDGQAGGIPNIYYTGGDIGTGAGLIASAYTAGAGWGFGGACVHDNKLYVWNLATKRLEWTTTPQANTGWATSGATINFLPNEGVVQLIEWRDRNGRAAIYVLTNRRLFWYDEDGDTLALFYDFTTVASYYCFPRMHVFQRTGDLYLALNDRASGTLRDTVLWFSGTTNLVWPNLRGGLPGSNRAPIIRVQGGLHWLYLWAGDTNKNATTSPYGPGRALALNDQQGWHTLYTGTNAQLYTGNGGKRVIGGGYGNGWVLTVLGDGSVVGQYVPDNTDLPLLSTDRSYQTGGPFWHEYAFTDGGTPNMPKQALWVTVGARAMTATYKTQGLPAGGSVVVQYRRDTDNAWATIGTLTSADTFPAVLPISGGAGVSFKQIKLRLGLQTTDSTVTPVVTSVALAYLRQEVPRYAYTLAVDLSDASHPFYKNQSRAQLLRTIESWAQPGAIVGLTFAGGDFAGQDRDVATTVANCTVAFSGQDDPDDGPQQYTLVFSDYSPPASG